MDESIQKHAFKRFHGLFLQWKGSARLSWKDYDELVKSKEIHGIGYSHLGHIFGKSDFTKLTLPMIQKICKAFGKDYHAVCEECGITVTTESEDFGSRNIIIAEQSSLGDGDEVWIIGSTRFLEASDSDIRKLVLDKLKDGVVYKYFFPFTSDSTQLDHPHGDESFRSFMTFVDTHLSSVKFTSIPRVFGFGLNPRAFPYFSKLHTLVFHFKKSPPRAFQRMYAYMPHTTQITPFDEELYEWWPLPRTIANEIQASVANSITTDAYFSPHKIAQASSHTKLAKRYRDFYSEQQHLRIYDDFRSSVNIDSQVLQLIAEVGEELEISGDNDLNILDIGCGDGSLSFKMATALNEYFSKIKITLLDSSEKQLDRARAQPWGDIDVIFEQSTFEQFPLTRGSFKLITSIHSFYAISPAYVQNVHTLLAPGGIAFLWLASGQDNIVARICDAIDCTSFPEQKRTDAEGLIRMCEWLSIADRGRFDQKLISNSISNPLLLQENSREFMNLVSFCALKPFRSADHGKSAEFDIARSVINSQTQNGDESDAELNAVDLVLTFRKNQ